MNLEQQDFYSGNRRRGIPGLSAGLNEINVTPLVDVMLVLLIIFMVTAPMLKHGIDVALPQASERLFPEGTESRYILTIAEDQQIYLDNRQIPLEHLEFKLRSLNESASISALFLEADRNLPYGYVVEVMDIVKKSGIKTMGMVTKPKVIPGK
ncbi:biopolymer transporter ExbD [bacterium]|nr:biopolymer transporter ExbD [candidate division CSSED10-310 bacterium]